MPSAFVHCLISSVSFAGTTLASLAPCQPWTRGRAPPYAYAARTRSPHCAAVFVTPGLWQLNAPETVVAQRYGRPLMIDAPAKRSGCVASITDANAPPAENPTRNTFDASPP